MKIFNYFLIIILAFLMIASAHATPAFNDFHRRAEAGENLNIVFFGASLTWGANASDPLSTSYRANVARRFEAKYPRAHFHFYDAAIGGTNSQLGVFRLQRDVLRHKPDLVFLDFSANDDISTTDVETLSSYESLVRRIILDGNCPLVQVIFPFRGDIGPGAMAKMKRRDAHLAISRAYNTAVGDAIALINERVGNGSSKIDELWPIDAGHPGDRGYAAFADAAWSGYLDGVSRHLNCHAPTEMLYRATYMSWARVQLSAVGEMPSGWSTGIANRTSAYFDFLMSRWLEGVMVASNSGVSAEPERFKAKFRGTMVMLLGECTLKSGKYRTYIDEQLVGEYAPGAFAKIINGNGHHVQLVAVGLDAKREHSIEIEPIFDGDQEQELRLESICVAGGEASVWW
ncbi:SGNH/GDSL hydrolase family protein [bacterium]|nr:MAG: SGNH/GDSL hydrolase family protein [bacterium]